MLNKVKNTYKYHRKVRKFTKQSNLSNTQKSNIKNTGESIIINRV